DDVRAKGGMMGESPMEGGPMRLPRFRVRTLMIAVAFVAITSGTMLMWHRSCEYDRRAKYHAMILTGLIVVDGKIAGIRDHDLSEAEREYHDQLLGKYDRAARNPWLPVEPDPPPPE